MRTDRTIQEIEEQDKADDDFHGYSVTFVGRPLHGQEKFSRYSEALAALETLRKKIGGEIGIKLFRWGARGGGQYVSL